MMLYCCSAYVSHMVAFVVAVAAVVVIAVAAVVVDGAVDVVVDVVVVVIIGVAVASVFFSAILILIGVVSYEHFSLLFFSPNPMNSSYKFVGGRTSIIGS